MIDNQLFLFGSIKPDDNILLPLCEYGNISKRILEKTFASFVDGPACQYDVLDLFEANFARWKILSPIIWLVKLVFPICTHTEYEIILSQE